jgi:hypothetical protein
VTYVLEIDGGILRVVERSIHISDVEGLRALVGDTDEDLVNLTDGHTYEQEENRGEMMPRNDLEKIKIEKLIGGKNPKWKQRDSQRCDETEASRHQRKKADATDEAARRQTTKETSRTVIRIVRKNGMSLNIGRRGHCELLEELLLEILRFNVRHIDILALSSISRIILGIGTYSE